MRIPEIQNQLRELSQTIALLAEELSRRPPIKRAPVTSDPVAPELRRAVRRHSRANPKESYASIARRFNINPGRVSEILAGKRK